MTATAIAATATATSLSLAGFTARVRTFVLERKPDLTDLALDADTDLIDSRLIDSLSFIEFLLFLEDSFGQEIDAQTAGVDSFRTAASIFRHFGPGPVATTARELANV